jgi:putative ATP-dependent endonuclease of OLD family
LEYDLALYGCGELMHTAIALGVTAASKQERLSEADEVMTIAAAHDSWEALSAGGHTPEKLAAILYQPLYEKGASKAITAQYAAHLVSTGQYGSGAELFGRLPPYLQRAFDHLAPAAPAAPAPAPVAAPMQMPPAPAPAATAAMATAAPALPSEARP